MNESSPFEHQEGSLPTADTLPPQSNPLSGQYRFSPEELRVLQECNQESFFQRSLPIGTAMGLGAFFAIQKGHLKPNPRFGVFPKVTLAVVMGYFIGKLSYQQACADKLMNLPGSYIGQLLREKRDGRTKGSSSRTQPPSMFGAGPSDIYSDAGPGSSLNLDTDRPIFTEDAYRPDTEGIIAPESNSPRPTMSYDELRKQNRSQYSDSKQDPYRLDPEANVPPVTRKEPPPTKSSKRNRYGDEME